MKNYYELLEVSKNASSEIINKVYKYKIKQNHPDLFQGEEKLKAEEITKELTEAYNILSNEEKRKEYDTFLESNDTKLNQLIYMNKLYKKENEMLKYELTKKDELISTYLDAINLNNYSDSIKNETSSSKKDPYFSELLYNNEKNLNNETDIPFYKYLLHTLKDISIKILMIIVFIIICIVLISSLTKTNALEIIFNSFGS